jgi:hypothetical protein
MKLPAIQAGLLCAALIAMGPAARAEDAPPPPASAAATVPQSPASAEDVATLDGILSTLYGTISGAPGQPRNWARLRSLFAHDGHMVVHGMNKSGEMTTRVLSVSDYISRVTPVFEKDGFYESELARSTDTFGQIAQVFSTYESRHAPDEAKPFQRGINSIQLVNDGQRWWIQSLVWQAESDRNPIPVRYLKGKQ